MDAPDRHYALVDTRVEEKLAGWDRWVTELEDHPLVEFEYDEMLSIRDAMVELLEIAGDESLRALADEIDARFADITVDEVIDDAKSHEDRAQWWRTRVPKDENALRYLKGDY